MKKSTLTALCLVLGILVTPLTFAISNLPTNGIFPDTINLKQDCTNVANCATTISDIQTWIDTYKKPNEAAPLLVNVGPGIFKGGFACNGWSSLSFKGAGPDQSFFAAKMFQSAMRGVNCHKFNVQDMTFTSIPIARFSQLAPVQWDGTGSSTWTNVNIEPVSTYGWTETSCPSDPSLAPIHYWFSSRVQGGSKTGYTAICSKNWFFGSQIEVKPTLAEGSTLGPSVLYAIEARGSAIDRRPEVHLYGSNVSVILPAGMSVPPAGVLLGEMHQGVNVISAADNAVVHVHGTGIDIIGNEMPNVVAALAATTGGSIHADQAAFNMKTGVGGSVIRIFEPEGGHKIHSPYLWPGHVNPPSITSVTGADTAVITNTVDGHPHVVVYDSTCGSKWYNIVMKACQ